MRFAAQRTELARLRFFDALRSVVRGHFAYRRRMLEHLRVQKHEWPNAYESGYFYQGLEELGIMGAKPTYFRFAQYEVDTILEGASVLDIGSNTGFVAIYCARLANSVKGVELNPHLIRCARETAKYLSIENAEFLQGDFQSSHFSGLFDVVLSLSNHHTIDGNLNLGFENHVRRISRLLKPDGHLLFESHNVLGPGDGGVGDDGDMDTKMETLSKYFEIERYRMVRRYLKYGDVDKLFIVARKSNRAMPIKFDLETARGDYSWNFPKGS